MASTLDKLNFSDLNKTNCFRNAMMVGITSGFGLGSLVFLRSCTYTS